MFVQVKNYTSTSLLQQEMSSTASSFTNDSKPYVDEQQSREFAAHFST